MKRKSPSQPTPPSPTLSTLPLSSTKIASLRAYLSNEPPSHLKTYPNHDNVPIAPYGTPKILLLCGPSGSCKRTLLTLLCRDLHMTPTFFHHVTDISYNKMREADMQYISEIDALEGFLETWASAAMRRSRGIIMGEQKSNKVFVIPQMPHAQSRKAKERLASLLRKYSGYDYAMRRFNGRAFGEVLEHPYARRPPLVILHTTYDAPTIYSSLSRTFPQELLTGKFLGILELLAVTQIRIEKVLRSVVATMPGHVQQGITSKLITDIAENANGDLKQALQQLEFSQYSASQRKRRRVGEVFVVSDDDEEEEESSDDDVLVLNEDGSTVRLKTPVKRKRSTKSGGKATSKPPNSRSSKPKAKTKPPPSTTRDNYFEVFHAAGKILHGRRKPNGEFDFDHNNLMHQVHTSEDSLINYVYHNMHNFYAHDAIEDVANTLETFACADSFSSRTSRDYGLQKAVYPAYSFHIATRGMLYHNKHKPAKLSKLPIHAPCLLKVQRESERAKEEGAHLFGLSKDEDMSLVDKSVVVQEIVPSRRLMHPSTAGLTTEQRSYLQRHQYTKTFSQMQNAEEDEDVLGGEWQSGIFVPAAANGGKENTTAENALPEAIEDSEDDDMDFEDSMGRSTPPVTTTTTTTHAAPPRQRALPPQTTITLPTANRPSLPPQRKSPPSAAVSTRESFRAPRPAFSQQTSQQSSTGGSSQVLTIHDSDSDESM